MYYMKEYSNYIFDFDYTLFDTSKGMNECYERAFLSINLEYKQSELNLYVQESLEATFYRYSNDSNLFPVFEKTFLETSHKCMLNLSVPYADTKDTLEALKACGKKMYIVTGKPQKRVEELLEKYKCLELITDIVGYGEYRFPKPSPESLNICINSNNLTLTETVYVGDSPYDMTAAQGAGIDGILICRDLSQNGISTLWELLRDIKIELFTVISTEYDIYKSKKWESILDQWCLTNGYALHKQSKSSVLIKIDDHSELSINKNGIIILCEYVNPRVDNIPRNILEWKETINTNYKNNHNSRPWVLLSQYETLLSRHGRSLRCPFPSTVHYTLIAYNYIPINTFYLTDKFAKQDILWLLTKNRVEKVTSHLSITDELISKGVCVEQYSDNSFFSGLWGARLIVTKEERDPFFKDYVEIERNIQTLWIMLSLTNDYIDKKVALENGNRALSRLVNFLYDIMFFEAEFNYINAKTSHRYQLNTIKLLLKLSNLNDISQYFKSKSELLEKKLSTSNNQKQEENGSILNFTLLILTIVSSIAAIFDVISLWSNNGINTNYKSLVVSSIIAITIIVICVVMKLYLRLRR